MITPNRTGFYNFLKSGADWGRGQETQYEGPLLFPWGPYPPSPVRGQGALLRASVLHVLEATGPYPGPICASGPRGPQNLGPAVHNSRKSPKLTVYLLPKKMHVNVCFLIKK